MKTKNETLRAILLLVGCLVLLQQFSNGTNIMVSVGADDPRYSYTYAQNGFDLYDKKGDESNDPSGIPESFFTSYNSDGSIKEQQVGNFINSSRPISITGSFDALSHVFQLVIGTGTEQLVQSVTVRQDFFFNSIDFYTYVNKGPFTAQGALKMDITKFNGQSYDIHLQESNPGVSGENTYARFWWEKTLPQQSFSFEMTATFGAGYDYNQSIGIGPILATLTAAPEPTTATLLLGAIAVLLRRRRS